ncbi:protein unc-93 homolog A-like [Amphiura filiformis]|uniref:protein unc-93 homolog A-like n=1 Tax=Amphiura filiformis TaxID=82378 RepID=UPI003B21F040
MRPKSINMRIELKNLFGVSISLFLSCGAWTAVYSLSSTIHAAHGLGLASFSLLFVGHAIVCLFAPVLVAKFGTKYSLVVGMLCWVIYIGCHLYPKWYVLLPVSILVGLGSTPLWIAAATHLTSSAIQMAKSSTEFTTQSLISRFIGVYYLAQLFSTIPGNLVSSLVLFQGTSSIVANHSTEFCASQDCGNSKHYDESNNSTIEAQNHIDPRTEMILFCSLLTCCVVGLFVVIVTTDFLQTYCDDLPQQSDFKATFKMTTRIMTSTTFLLALPLIALNGFELGFLYGVFTKSFVSCTLGVQTIGLVMTVSGCGGALFSISGGTLAKYTGWIPIATFGFLSHGVLVICMLLWKPFVAYDNKWHLFVMGFMLSGGAILRSTHVTALLGILYPRDQEAAYGAQLFFHFLCYALPTALRIPNQVCTSHILFTQLVLLILATLGYYLLEWRVKKHAKRRGEKSEYKPTKILHIKDMKEGDLMTTIPEYGGYISKSAEARL